MHDEAAAQERLQQVTQEQERQQKEEEERRAAEFAVAQGTAARVIADLRAEAAAADLW